MKWIDVHAHLDKLEDGPDAAIQEALAAGVERIITIGTEPGDHPFILEAINKWSPYVYGTLGVHPHDAGSWNAEVGKFIKNHIHNPRILAVGEIGLDYYYKHSEPEIQRQAFREQIELAIECNMPIEIHTRDAEEDTIAILNEYCQNKNWKALGLIHCFTGTSTLARAAVELGFHISISGVVTFKNADALRAVVKEIPLSHLHIETDAPFLAPAPHRGRKNVPALMIHTAQKVADIKGITLEELNREVLRNAEKLFPRLKMGM